MLTIQGRELVLWLHVLAACIWIGGQVTVAAVIPLLREHQGLAALAGRRYQQIAWPAFAVLVGTGIANTANAHISWADLTSTPVGRTLLTKLGLVALSGLAAAVHGFLQAPRAGRHRTGPPSPATSAVLGSLSLLAAVGAALYGVVIAG
jgi:putative copper export protein